MAKLNKKKVGVIAGGVAALAVIGVVATTLIVNGPTGAWFCADDTYGTLDPTIDITDPGSGAYDIWVGSYSSEATISGEMNVTEDLSKHPGSV